MPVSAKTILEMPVPAKRKGGNKLEMSMENKMNVDTRVERLMEKTIEEKLVNVILEQATENNLTISNIRSIANKVIKHLENNAVLGMKMEHPTELSVPLSSKS